MSKFDETLKKYLDTFHNQETYFTEDTRNLELYAANPANAREEDIRVKLSALTDADFVKLGAIEEMTKHILKLNIDAKLKAGDLSVVEDIANVTLNGKKQYLLRAASQYCNLHRPDVFPIYSDEHIDFYKNYIKEYNLKLTENDLMTYKGFSAALNDLVSRLGLKGKMNYLQIRKFGWLYAKKVVDESKGA